MTYQVQQTETGRWTAIIIDAEGRRFTSGDFDNHAAALARAKWAIRAMFPN
jgi:hypothetical protein